MLCYLGDYIYNTAYVECCSCCEGKHGGQPLSLSLSLQLCVWMCFMTHCHFLCSPFAYVDPLHCNMAYLYLELLKDSLNEYAYAAELAGLNYDLQNTVYGMYVSIQNPSLTPHNPDHVHLLLSSSDRAAVAQPAPGVWRVLGKKDFLY